MYHFYLFYKIYRFFVDNGIKDENFFAIDDDLLKSLVKDEPNCFDFIVGYSFEKGRLVEKNKEANNIELMELSSESFETIASTSSNFSLILL